MDELFDNMISSANFSPEFPRVKELQYMKYKMQFTTLYSSWGDYLLMSSIYFLVSLGNSALLCFLSGLTLISFSKKRKKEKEELILWLWFSNKNKNSPDQFGSVG